MKMYFILKSMLFTSTLCFLIGFSSCTLSYHDAREAIVDAEERLMTGGQILLSPKEKLVNNILLKTKFNEINEGLSDPTKYPPGMHFFQAKDLIEQTKIFKFIKKMPKGAVLHGHNTAMVSSNWIIKNLTYRSDILKCINKYGVVVFTFRQYREHECSTYIRIIDERAQAPDIELYDRELEKSINLYTPTPEIDYPNIGLVWNKFQNMFTTVGDMIAYLPVYRAYHQRLLEEMYEDGVMYIEFRTSFSEIYDGSSRKYTKLDVAHEIQIIIKEFKEKHPDFLGAKAIYSITRKNNPVTMYGRINAFRELYTTFPNFILGFDLVGQEDLGKPLYDFIIELQSLPQGAQFFFHAGETNWYGSTIDFNLLDAILLNTTRIGHGYALMKHPVLWNAVKTRGVCVEVNPVSNQVLHLVWDMRNHPAAFFISENIPTIISNDDPGFWNAKGLSYDFYYAFMSFTPNYAGLKTLKQLVWNSIKYSILTIPERKRAAEIFQKKWEIFLDDILTRNEI